MGFLIHLLIASLFVLSCSQVHSPISTSAPEDQKFQKKALGEVRTLDDATFDLDAIEKDAIVLVFASETCATCFEEVQYWKNEFSKGYPVNIYFAHYLLGGHLGDALEWKNTNLIQWPVLYNPTDELYQTFCSAIITPCFLILNNQTNELVQTYKVLKKEEIEGITGKWKY